MNRKHKPQRSFGKLQRMVGKKDYTQHGTCKAECPFFNKIDEETAQCELMFADLDYYDGWCCALSWAMYARMLRRKPQTVQEIQQRNKWKLSAYCKNNGKGGQKMNEFQADLDRTIRDVWEDFVCRIEMRGELEALYAWRPEGLVEGFRRGLNAIADKAGTPRIAQDKRIANGSTLSGESALEGSGESALLGRWPGGMI